jgi:hypothetical protein
MIFSAPNAPIGMFKLFLDIKNNKARPLDPTCLECLNVWSSVDLLYSYNSIVTKKQLKILPICFVLNPTLQIIF